MKKAIANRDRLIDTAARLLARFPDRSGEKPRLRPATFYNQQTASFARDDATPKRKAFLLMHHFSNPNRF
jgi:hypothetical protein